MGLAGGTAYGIAHASANIAAGGQPPVPPDPRDLHRFYTSLVRRSAGKATSYPMAFTLVKSQVPEWDGRADCEEMPFVALSISSK
jgi:hypothetical protein